MVFHSRRLRAAAIFSASTSPRSRDALKGTRTPTDCALVPDGDGALCFRKNKKEKKNQHVSVLTCSHLLLPTPNPLAPAHTIFEFLCTLFEPHASSTRQVLIEEAAEAPGPLGVDYHRLEGGSSVAVRGACLLLSPAPADAATVK